MTDFFKRINSFDFSVRRFFALGLDIIACEVFILIFFIIPYIFTVLLFGDKFQNLTMFTFLLVSHVFGFLFFFLIKDYIYENQSFGKRLMNVEIINSTRILKSRDILIRNVSIFIFPVEMIAILISPKKRLGDIIANTSVEDIVRHKSAFNQKVIIYYILFWLFFWITFFSLDVRRIDYIDSSYNIEKSEFYQNELMLKSIDFSKEIDLKYYEEIENSDKVFVDIEFNFIDVEEFNSIEKIKREVLDDIFSKDKYVLKVRYIFKSSHRYKYVEKYYGKTDNGNVSN